MYPHVTPLPNKQGYIIPDVFTKEECKWLIQEGENMGFRGLQGYGKDYRTNTRVIAKSNLFADILLERLVHYLDDEVVIDGLNSTYNIDYNTFGTWALHGMNPMFRLCKYDPNQFFKPHYDEGYSPNPDRITLKTCMLYLNNDFDGGETVFYGPDKKTIMYCLKASPGMVLVFNQRIWHEGMTVTSGQKYFIRTDIFYNRVKREIPKDRYSERELKAIRYWTDYCDTNHWKTPRDEIDAIKKYEKYLVNQSIEDIIYKDATV